MTGDDPDKNKHRGYLSPLPHKPDHIKRWLNAIVEVEALMSIDTDSDNEDLPDLIVHYDTESNDESEYEE